MPNINIAQNLKSFLEKYIEEIDIIIEKLENIKLVIRKQLEEINEDE